MARGRAALYDWIGGEDQAAADYVNRIRTLCDAGHTDRILLSRDRGWYDPSEPGGGEQKPYTYLTDEFLPRLRESESTGTRPATARRRTPCCSEARCGTSWSSPCR